MSSGEQARQTSMEQTGLYGQDLDDYVDSMREAHPIDSEATSSLESRGPTAQDIGNIGVSGATADIIDHRGFYAEYED